MMQYGASALSHAELLAILLRTGTRQESAVHIAQRSLGKQAASGASLILALRKLRKSKELEPLRLFS